MQVRKLKYRKGVTFLAHPGLYITKTSTPHDIQERTSAPNTVCFPTHNVQ